MSAICSASPDVVDPVVVDHVHGHHVSKSVGGVGDPPPHPPHHHPPPHAKVGLLAINVMVAVSEQIGVS